MTMPEQHVDMNAFGLQELLEQDGALILDRLRYWVEKDGDRPCMLYGETGQRLSYAEFDQLTDSIAGNLVARGVARGSPVAVYTRNQYVSILAMVGIWKAGAVFAPVNFNLGGRLLHYQLNDTRPCALITDPGLLGVLAEIWDESLAPQWIAVHEAAVTAHADACDAKRSDVTGITADVLDWRDMLVPARRPAVQVEFDDVASIIYTSGTTGPAKGVVQLHRWMNHYTFMFRQLLDQDDVVYNDLPIYHVGGAIFNIVRAFWAGASVACWDRFSPNQFWGRIRQSGATSAVLLDTMISWLAKRTVTSEDNAHTLRKVHMQPLPERHHDISRRFGFDLVTCGFGQTESGLSCYAIIEETDEMTETPAQWHRGRGRAEIIAYARRLSIPVFTPVQARDIGRGFMGSASRFMDVAILDERDRHCAPGQIGQLALRPKLPGLVMREYLGKPEATSLAFRNLWFHTGDSAWQTPDNMFYFNDRMGDRIRVRGENTSSFHVEDLINQCPGVAMSAAFGIPAEEGLEDDIAVYVVAHNPDLVTAEKIHEWARDQMPKFMRPRYVRVVEELPRTLTQKVEKFKLRRLLLNELGASEASVK